MHWQNTNKRLTMKKLIDDFEKKCNEWQARYDNDDVKFVFNEDLKLVDFSQLKYILVADNPGKNEAEEKRYLIGPAGMAARVYFEKALVDDFKKEVVVLNKTPVHTNITMDLSIKNSGYLSESQEYMVDLIVSLIEIKPMPVIIMGYSGGLNSGKKALTNSAKNTKPLRFFFRRFAEAVMNGDISDYYLISHFSRNMFYNSKYIGISDYEESPDLLLKKQGKIYREMFEKGFPEK